MTAGRISVEVVFAGKERQVLLALQLDAGARVADAIKRSCLHEQFPGEPLDTLPVGIWGRPTERSERLRNGDRVEIYRPLEVDPKEARRLRATRTP
jgi:putative ubiquitin-RnfH superfamily antitoxin RatB of RatAB toxin-antitoxin module